MSLPSPFRYLEWNAETNGLIVEPALPKTSKRWGLISVDGVSTEELVKTAKTNDGATWLHNFAVMLPNYVLMAAPSQADTFVISGIAHVEVEDLDSHEIEELTVDATEEAFDEAIRSWKHDLDSAAPTKPHTEGQPPQHNFSPMHGMGGDDSDDDYEDVDEEEEEGEEKQQYMEKRQLLDQFAMMLDLTNKMAKKFQLTPTQMRSAFTAAGGVLLTQEEEGVYAKSHDATASFLQTASAASNGQQQCPQQ
ncbi:Hypothetical protein, putative [Bodo saltans]|uniref:Uncharacterized protein n=1 Tax=Bodo saltans TaxID=75058 RepID=A0A0S4J501_BODSA|nr:Hypothetical protein, putative [Bodo saltans]|eukprot:CUG86293.1 Hypothetical protein, putative [Bodo saltans]